MGIAQQLEPYIKSITSLMEHIQPEVGGQQQSQPLAALAGKALKREVRLGQIRLGRRSVVGGQQQFQPLSGALHQVHYKLDGANPT